MQNDDYQTFINAVMQNDIKTVEKYLKIVDPSKNKNGAIGWASGNGYLEIVKLLLSDERADPSADDNWAIRFASKNGHLEVVKLLLSDSRVDPSARNNIAIRYASENSHTEVVKLLLSDSRVDPSADYNLAIRIASFNGHTEVVKLLLSDSRVDFDAIQNKKIKEQLLKDERNKLRKELVFGYRTIEKISPQITYDEKQKLQIPRSIIRKMVYGAAYQELCSKIPGNIPPVKLLALADLLKIKYDRNTSYSELCGRVKLVLMNFDHWLAKST